MTYRSRCMLPAPDGDGGRHCSYVVIADTVEGVDDAWRAHVAAVHGDEWLRDPWAAHVRESDGKGHGVTHA